MFQYKNNHPFYARIKDDKPIAQINSNDFDDFDIKSNISFISYTNSEADIDISQAMNNNNFLKSSLTNTTFSPKEQEEHNKNEKLNISLNSKNKKSNENKINDNKEKISINNNICIQDDNLYSDKEDCENTINENKNEEDEKETDEEKKIEKVLIRSITKKESVTREKIYLAESIRFKDEPETIINTDQYGFVQGGDNLFSKKDTILSEKSTNNKIPEKDLLKINARIEKWNYMLKNYKEFSTSKRKILKSRTRKGIPDSLRGYVWQLFAEKEKYYVPNIYKDLQKESIDEELEKVIVKDLDRTFPLCQFFSEKYGNGQRKLYKVLSVYSLFNKNVGYVQGMGFLTAIFLTYMDEESSFFMLHSLMIKYKMEGIFLEGFPELKKYFFVLLKLQKKFLPKIYGIFQRDGILPTMYASTWCITLFFRVIEFHIALRIFDCFLLEGFKVIFRVSLALLKLKENEFYNSEQGNCLIILNQCTNNIDIDELFKIAFDFSLSHSYINKCEEEYEKVKNDEKNEFMAQLVW